MAVSYSFEGEPPVNRVLCEYCTNDAYEYDPGAWSRLLEPGEKLADVWR